jgi:hypothetical protein
MFLMKRNQLSCEEASKMEIKLNRAIMISFLSVILVLSSSLCSADEIYVDCRNTAGPWDGTINKPYQSIQDAIDSTTTYDGDTIRVADCIYQEGILVDKNLKIYGSGPDVTTIDSTTVEGKNYAILFAENTDVIISGFMIVSPGSGLRLKWGSKVVIANNIINAQYGIYGQSACGADALIKNNTIASCTEDGINLISGCNPFYDPKIVAKVYNNIITNNYRYGLATSSMTILSNSYNNIWNNGTNYIDCSSGSGSISENPRFLDQNTGNYRLQLISSCIDAGWPVKSELDPDGTRNNMGAYGGPGAADFWPDSPGSPVVTDLTVTPASVPTNGTVTIRAVGRVRPYSPGQE